jgi:hypothetical protein
MLECVQPCLFADVLYDLHRQIEIGHVAKPGPLCALFDLDAQEGVILPDATYCTQRCGDVQRASHARCGEGLRRSMKIAIGVHARLAVAERTRLCAPSSEATCFGSESRTSWRIFRSSSDTKGSVPPTLWMGTGHEVPPASDLEESGS